MQTLVLQVLKERLALVSPTVVADAFMYEEGPDLDEDEAAESAAHRPTPLAALPGGGIRHGSIVAISDQAQAFEASLVISHRVGCFRLGTGFRNLTTPRCPLLRHGGKLNGEAWQRRLPHPCCCTLCTPPTACMLRRGGIKHPSFQKVPSHCPQDQWDEEKEPEGFLLEGAVPATAAEGADLPNPFFFAFVL